MQVRLLLGPAGSGKTFRCLAEIRQSLAAAPEGPALLLVAPKQTTYQLERLLLADPAVGGYTRLRILSFERLADFIFEQLGQPSPELLDEEGRLMVLRGLLARKREELKLFRASARLTGFARELSVVLRELQRHNLTPETLTQLAAQMTEVEGLAFKLQDLATLLQDYLAWLKAHHLQDADYRLTAATEALEQTRTQEQSAGEAPAPTQGEAPRGNEQFKVEHVFVDGFAEWAPQELELLAALVPFCEKATLTFCLDRVPRKRISWLSSRSIIWKAFERCQERLARVPGAEVTIQKLTREPNRGRFADHPALQHLEEFWAEPKPYSAALAGNDLFSTGLEESLRVAACPDPDNEVRLAAREILRHVHSGGRYRETGVLVRKLERFHEPIQRIFPRYEIPFFLDRRESVSHHPLAELTRSALRTVALHWAHDDWFAALKTGLSQAEDHEIDELENEALARGWKGTVWHSPLRIQGQPTHAAGQEKLLATEQRLEQLRQRIVPPFQRLELAMATCQNRPTGVQLAEALRKFWQGLDIEGRLKVWSVADRTSSEFPTSVHGTVWQQMGNWLKNVELAFPTEALPLREWLPILETGLAGLTVGVIPPALDQVVIGALDRSRDSDLKLVIVLGLDETVFPALPEGSVLLSEGDRAALEKRNVILSSSAQQQLGRERYYAYVACTRARERLVLTRAVNNADGSPLNPSPFLLQVKQLFPSLRIENVPAERDWRKSEHAHELIVPMLRMMGEEQRGSNLNEAGAQPQPAKGGGPKGLSISTFRLPAPLQRLMGQLRQYRNLQPDEPLSPALAAQLYGPILQTSVSRMEQYAACPFRFFVNSGLRAEERKLFELDVREQGSFQHDVLACFHEQLCREKKRWRDITPAEARERVGKLAAGLLASYREGLLQATEQSRFMARVMTESLQDFAETLVGWMRDQYRFDPAAVELAFGAGGGLPSWELGLGAGQRLALNGRIDRVDICPIPGGNDAWCVVLDYKSSAKKLDDILMENGLQLQLLTYLNVARRRPASEALFGVKRLLPAGVFYVNLRGTYASAANRDQALADMESDRKMAYRHAGRFDDRVLRQLDARPEAQVGDQFNYRLTKKGVISQSNREALPATKFEALLDSVESNLKRMGEEIFSGKATVAPYRNGTKTACDQCSYEAICRIDPWIQRFRVLKSTS